MAPADLEVVGVVPGRDLQRTGAELRLDVLVGDDLQPAPNERQDRALADQALIALIVGVHGDRRVGEHRLRSHRGDRDRARPGDERIVDVVELVGHLDVLDLEIRDRRAAPRIPVDQVPVAVDVALLVQGDEHAQDRLHVLVIEREPLFAVVAGGAEALELLDDRAAVLGAPLPHPLHERVAPELGPVRALLGERALHLRLGGDPGMVGSEDPLDPPAAQTLVADQTVLHRVVQRVAHVQQPGHVRRRDGDRVVLRRGTRRLGVEQAGIEPRPRDPRLDGGGVVAGLLFEVAHRGTESRRPCLCGVWSRVTTSSHPARGIRSS